MEQKNGYLERTKKEAYASRISLLDGAELGQWGCQTIVFVEDGEHLAETRSQRLTAPWKSQAT